ncbi:DUF3460 family protein [Neisseriaceae bacterium ESL0693]|nr:DUF3460 family protein [Neisseriaceae bacterium ESL0693]
MYNYQSDATQFLNQYLEKNPEEAKARLQHRNLLWDVELNPEDEAGFAAAALPKKGYPYESE